MAALFIILLILAGLGLYGWAHHDGFSTRSRPSWFD